MWLATDVVYNIFLKDCPSSGTFSPAKHYFQTRKRLISADPTHDDSEGPVLPTVPVPDVLDETDASQDLVVAPLNLTMVPGEVGPQRVPQLPWSTT